MSDARRPISRVTLQSLRISRAPGIDRGFTLNDLGEGVTVIHGRNGSGKTTTAGAIGALFWPIKGNNQLSIDATFTVDDDRWEVTREGTHVQARFNGEPANAPAFDSGTAGTNVRHHLALHDLLVTDDADFARHISREALGGYDLEAAAKALNLDKSPASAKGAADSVRAAKQKHAALIAEQQRIQQDELRLTSLREQSAQRNNATAVLGQLNLIEVALHARQAADEAAAIVGSFPAAMTLVDQNDAANLARWNVEEQQHQKRRHELERLIAIQSESLLALGLPAERDCEALRRELGQVMGPLKEHESRRAENERLLRETRASADRLVPGLLRDIPEPLRSDAGLAELRAWARALERHAQARSIGQAQMQLKQWISEPDALGPAAELSPQIDMLVRWLQTPPPAISQTVSTWLRIVALAASLLLAAAGAWLAREVDSRAYLVVGIGIVLAIASLMLRVPRPVPDSRHKLVDHYRTIGVPEPASWTPEDVATMLGDLQIAFVQRLANEQNAMVWKQVAPALEEREQAMSEAAQSADALEASLGFAIDLDAPALNAAATRLERWLDLSRECERLQTSIALDADAIESAIIAFNRLAEGIMPEQIETGASAERALARLDDLLLRKRTADEAIRTANEDLNVRVLPELRRINHDRSALVARFGGLSRTEIDDLAARYEPYTKAIREHERCEATFAFQFAQIKPPVDLAQWTLADVQLRRDEQARVLENASKADEELGSIEERIRIAGTSGQIARVLEERAMAHDALLKRRSETLERIAGQIVLDAVRNETREANLPAVAHHARELFSRFTFGEFELEFNAGSSSEFRARDTRTNQRLHLHELSSGTRVQLLIAVRAAFVATNEHHAQLPMLFDETLANSDDARAHALIDATFELAKAGRQVFYFTAQRDEVEKWIQRGRATNTEVRVIDLDEVRHLGRRSLTIVPPTERVDPWALPSPDGMDRAAYKHALGVAPIDIWNDTGGDIHLWYLIDDVQELHRICDAGKVQYWGQLAQFSPGTAQLVLGLNPESFERIRHRAEATQVLARLHRIGRGRPLTPEDLDGSGAITQAFRERCLNLLKITNGDGASFLNNLEKNVSGFRTKSLEALRDYLSANGHVGDGNTLSHDQLRARTANECIDAIERGDLDMATIDRLLAEAFPVPTPITQFAKTVGLQSSLLPSD